MKCSCVVLSLVAAWVACAGGVEQAVQIKADFSRPIGAVKPMHGVGQPPRVNALSSWSMVHYLEEAGVPFSRLHDMGGWLGGGLYCDIPNVFPNFDADENDPKNYRFAFTDSVMKALVDHHVEPFFRLGVTIENWVAYGKNLPPVNCYPPKDPAKWARICEHVIRHYTEGWANGYTWKTRYWEIWNEPENHPDPKQNPMFIGTWDQYLELYGVTSKHLKKCFPHLKIGGYGSCGFYAAANSPAVASANSSPRTQYFVDCYLKFLDYVKKNNCPMDFFSFHTYSDVKEARRQVDWGIATLHAAGFTNVETTLNEWLPRVRHENLGTACQASAICAELITLQQSKLDSAMIYDARCGVGNYSPLFNPMTYKPHKAYYALKAFNEAYKLKTAVESSSSDADVYALAASADQKNGVILVANSTKRAIPLTIDCGGKDVKACRLTDADHTYEEVALPKTLPPESFLLLTVCSKSWRF